MLFPVTNNQSASLDSQFALVVAVADVTKSVNFWNWNFLDDKTPVQLQ